MHACGSVLVQMKEIFLQVREMHFLAMHFSLESIVCLSEFKFMYHFQRIAERSI